MIVGVGSVHMQVSGVDSPSSWCLRRNARLSFIVYCSALRESCLEL